MQVRLKVLDISAGRSRGMSLAYGDRNPATSISNCPPRLPLFISFLDRGAASGDFRLASFPKRNWLRRP